MGKAELEKQRAMWRSKLAEMEAQIHQLKSDPSLWLEHNDQVELVRAHLRRLDELINDTP
jgi:hypothetical protein